jgi:uncharacterized protein (TIGR04222 family)
MNTWGISGPQFLVLYAALFAVTLVGVVLARRRVLASGDRAAVAAHLDPYQAAYLNGGGDLAVLNAASNLLRRGSLANAGRRRGQQARLVAGAAPDAAAHPVEWALYQQVAATPNRRLKDLQGALTQAPALAALGERLRLDGLAPTPEQRARYRRMGLWFAPLLALGVARLVAGTANGRPVGFLVLFLLVTVVVAAALVLRAPDATELGRRTLERLRAEHPRPAVGASPAELSMGTALFGAGALWAADTDIAIMQRIPRERGAFAGGYGGDGGGFGGGGGGDGGGGGGGGCGGGGCGG